MIDIHSHILPGVDDGAYEMEESVDMVTMAAESGVKYIVATPHCNIPGLMIIMWMMNFWNIFMI